MQEQAFKDWLTARNVTKNAIATRTYSVKKVDSCLTELGFDFVSLDDAWKAGAFDRVTGRLRDMISGLSQGDESYRIILPQTEKPEMRLRNFISWVGQYRQFLEDQSGAGKRSDWPALEHMRDQFLERVPDFQSFQADEGEYYEIERRYKQAILDGVAEARARLGDDPEALGREIVALMQTQSGPLIRWQTTDWFQGEHAAVAPQFFGALGRLALSTAPIEADVRACIDALTSLHAQGVTALSRGEILSIALSVAGCADPMRSAPFKIRKAQALTKRLLDRALFRNDNNLDGDISAWLKLLERIYHTMSNVWEWAPRDLFDVQGFAWIVLDPAFNTEEDEDMVEASSEPGAGATASQPGPPRNLILYGPPGTGKTYEMAELAVELCDDDLPVNEDGLVDRARVQERYEGLRQRGRIEFVTFHQSYSYEEFVEGLRPDTGAPETGETSAGFRLQPEDGVFRRISRLAEKAKAPRPAANQSLERTGVFKASLGPTWDESFAYLFEECIENGYILLGYGGEVDWSSDEYLQFNMIRDKWKTIDADASGNDPNIKQVFTLRAAMKEGDLVVVSNGNLRFRAIGRITGPYQYVPREQDEYHHRRSVEWLWVDRGEGLSHSDIYEKRFSMQALYRMVDTDLKWPALEEIVSGSSSEDHGPPPSYVLIIDEINRANISKVFGELITLLEPDKRLGADNELRVRLPYSKEDFGVPANLHVLGTMNTADRSIALLDTALRRRFDFREMMPRPALLSEDVDGINLQTVLQTLNERIEYLFDRDHQIGHAYFMGRKTRAAVDEAIRLKVIPLLVEYFYEDWEKIRRVLGETTNEGGFISRSRIKAPVSSGDQTDSEDRWRYQVRNPFADTAYEQLES